MLEEEKDFDGSFIDRTQYWFYDEKS